MAGVCIVLWPKRLATSRCSIIQESIIECERALYTIYIYRYLTYIHIYTRRIAPARANGKAVVCVNYQIKRTYVTSYRKRHPPPPPSSFCEVCGVFTLPTVYAREIYDRPGDARAATLAVCSYVV